MIGVITARKAIHILHFWRRLALHKIQKRCTIPTLAWKTTAASASSQNRPQSPMSEGTPALHAGSPQDTFMHFHAT
ncbi:hypothetical protein V5799_025597 [Amblyomma americanum]|uniref:Uncharacterized protein n=1 Tax=Amblyomma americanum TaxID=6943 RepID=A0AAQ4E8U5_AMBAM